MQTLQCRHRIRDVVVRSQMVDELCRRILALAFVLVFEALSTNFSTNYTYQSDVFCVRHGEINRINVQFDLWLMTNFASIWLHLAVQ